MYDTEIIITILPNLTIQYVIGLSLENWQTFIKMLDNFYENGVYFLQLFIVLNQYFCFYIFRLSLIENIFLIRRITCVSKPYYKQNPCYYFPKLCFYILFVWKNERRAAHRRLNLKIIDFSSKNSFFVILSDCFIKCCVLCVDIQHPHPVWDWIS